jgi:tRNA nucleotidyltransferase (CCA-adding enzyme)
VLPDPALVPGDVLAVLRGLRAKGWQAWLAGGAVRDLVRKAEGLYSGGLPEDFDVATDALPEEVAKLFPRVVPTGLQHGTVTVLSGDHKMEVTTFRGEGPYLDGRRPSAVTFLGDIDGDLARRDFTINAMAWDPIDGVLRDRFGGVADLRRHLLRAVGDPLARFREDGLRPLRAVRFACTLRLALHPATRRAIPQTLDVFDKVAKERVRDEFVKLLVRGAPPSRGLRLLYSTGLLGKIIPELLESVGFRQNRYHAWDVWRHTLCCVDFAPADLTVRLAALLHDVAKPRCAAPKEGAPGENTFYDHEKVGADLSEEILTRLRFPSREIERVALLVREHNWHYLPEWNDATVRRTLARIGPAELPALWALRRADLQARGRLVEEGLANQTACQARFAAEVARAGALKISDLAITGEDVMRELGIGPGRQVGQVLAQLLDQVIDDPELNKRNDLIRLLAGIQKRLSTNNSQ